MECVNVLYLGPISDSIRFRPHLETIDSIPAITWWLKRFSPYPADSRLFIVCHSKIDAEKLSSLLAGNDATVHLPEDPSLFGSLAEVVQITHARRVAVLPLGLCLAPLDLLERAYIHHIGQENSITYVAGFPAAVSPIIFEAKCIPHVGSGNSQSRGPRPLGSLTTSVQSPDSVPFPAFSAYSLDPAELPTAISLDTTKDIEILGRVLSLMRDPNLPLRGMQLWKEELIRESESMSALAMPSSKTSRHARQRLRILFVSALSGFSGAEQGLCHLVESLDPSRFEKIVLTALEGHLTDRLRSGGAEVICPGRPFVENKIPNFLYCASLLGELTPDIVHQNGPGGLPLVSAAKSLEIPLVLHARCSPDDNFAEYAESADVIIAVSQFVRQQILRFNVRHSKVQVIHNGIDSTHFHPTAFDKIEARTRLKLSLDSKVVLCTARFDPQKRHDLFLRACTIVKKHLPSLRIILNGEAFGNTKYQSTVWRQADSLGLKDSISWIPFVTDIRPLQRASDVLVLCSENEGMGRCILESMAMELPVIATASGGNPELVLDKLTGWLVKPGDCEGLAHTMVAVLNGEQRLEPIVRAARLRIEQAFSLKSHIWCVAQLYESLCGRLRFESSETEPVALVSTAS